MLLISLSRSVESHCRFSRIIYSQEEESHGTYALVIGGERNSPVNAEEAQRIVSRLQAVVADNEGKVLTTVNMAISIVSNGWCGRATSLFHSRPRQECINLESG